jgi:outer membrane protease
MMRTTKGASTLADGEGKMVDGDWSEPHRSV